MCGLLKDPVSETLCSVRSLFPAGLIFSGTLQETLAAHSLMKNKMFYLQTQLASRGTAKCLAVLQMLCRPCIKWCLNSICSSFTLRIISRACCEYVLRTAAVIIKAVLCSSQESNSEFAGHFSTLNTV